MLTHCVPPVNGDSPSHSTLIFKYSNTESMDGNHQNNTAISDNDVMSWSLVNSSIMTDISRGRVSWLPFSMGCSLTNLVVFQRAICHESL